MSSAMQNMNPCGPCVVRRIEAGDAGRLQEFYNALGPAVHRIFRPLGWEAKLEACETIVADNAAAPERRYDLLALSGGQVAGWGFLWDLHTDAPSFGLGIAAAHRGLGLGTRLLDAVMDEARRRAVRRVLLTVVTDNAVAQQLYERKGFVRYDQYVDEKDGVPYYRMAWPAPP